MADLEEDETLNELISEIESTNSNFSEQTLISLHSLSSSPHALTYLFSRLSSLNLLLSPLSSSMDSTSTSLSLLASKTYLSLLISPSSPVFSLFTPVAFLSFLRSVRKSVKCEAADMPQPNPKNNRKKKKGAEKIDNRGQRGGESSKLIEEVMGLLVLALDKVRLDVAHDGLKSLVDTIVVVLESTAV